MTTIIAQCALEFWRASGAKTRERLFDLVEHFARVNGESDYVARHFESALAAVKSWEWPQ